MLQTLRHVPTAAIIRNSYVLPRLSRVTFTTSRQLPFLSAVLGCPPSPRSKSTAVKLSHRQPFNSSIPRYVKFTLPDELARSIPRDSKQRRVDNNAPLPSPALIYVGKPCRGSLEYWKKIARDKQEIPYQKFPSADSLKASNRISSGPDGPWIPLDECRVFSATTAEDWKAIDTFISQNAASRAIKETLMAARNAVMKEVRTPLTKKDLTIVNGLAVEKHLSTSPSTTSGIQGITKPANIHTHSVPRIFNRNFSSCARNNWAEIDKWIREAATQTAKKRRLGLGEEISGALAPLTREELRDLAAALDQSSPPPLTMTEDSTAMHNPPQSVLPMPKNMHTVNPTLDGQFSTSETIKIGQMTIKVLEDGSRTENRMSSVLITLLPGTKGTPLKANDGHGEGFFVLKGKIRFTTRRYLDADHTTKAAKASHNNRPFEAVVDADPAVHVADVGATSTSGDLLVPNKDMLEEILHAGARPVNVNHVMGEPEMDNEGISVDIDVKCGGWVTVPKGARYTFSNVFEEEAEILNTFTTARKLEEMRRLSEDDKGRRTTRESTSTGLATKTLDDGGS